MGGLGEQGRQDKDGFDDDGPAVSRLTNVALRERAYTELANALRAGRFSPGSPVTIRGLAALLGTSTMPVREAVSRLVTEGALELLPNRTLRVPDVSMERLDDLIDTRATLEGRAAWLAAERMTQADFSLIKAAAEDYSHAVDAGDVPAAVAANEQLHFTIYRASRSELLVSIIEMLWLQSGPYIAAVMKQMQSTREILHDRGIMHHFNILAALAKRDPQASSDAVQSDILDAAKWYKTQIFAADGTPILVPAAERKRRGRAPATTE
ncbi:GntR family transcriptional regulator [Cupriavidus sp. IDO]|uniref:GntR family transcriptional regulator n=1 Tax=Cupriavidus sp. IDO TaxID=1539142 RepID=UPI00057992FD|nr:GntR family transcriptional regulator [Cupriavidus sp. IDO]KWR90848.1 GntR family transcriptional regulator [Cupriavidus sp. IDO]